MEILKSLIMLKINIMEALNDSQDLSLQLQK